ncbi:methyltransferase [Streptomyces sp. NL15-2K]|uniref:methyltransferase n=1 Tax=Streptomyces sp. NL15-2K TaxID=376149 RepID=UPI000F5847DA|nr:methyltransferase [Streptomyces sp. NL15-2K]
MTQHAEDGLAGRENVGRDNVGRESAGRDDVGRESAGRDDVGRESAGQDNAGRESAGRENAGQDNVGRENRDGDYREMARWDDPLRLPTGMRALWIATQKYASQAVYVLAKLSVADLLADGPMAPADLAAETGADADALYRTLRCAASVGVFRETEDGRFELTAEAEVLQEGHPQSMRDLIILHGEDISWRQYEEILYSVRTGRPAFDRVFGAPVFDHLSAHPEKDALFHRAGAQVASAVTDAYLGSYDFGAFPTIADIGGGSGWFFGRLLQRNPGVQGIVLDRPSGREQVEKAFEELGVTDRGAFLPGDFFTSVPVGYDAYLLKSILHDWSDEQCATILRRVRQAMGASTARLLVLDSVLAPGNNPDHGKLLDIHMLVTFGGKERTLAEWKELLGRGGFELTGIGGQDQWPVLECRPVPGPA